MSYVDSVVDLACSSKNTHLVQLMLDCHGSYPSPRLMFAGKLSLLLEDITPDRLLSLDFQALLSRIVQEGGASFRPPETAGDLEPLLYSLRTAIQASDTALVNILLKAPCSYRSPSAGSQGSSESDVTAEKTLAEAPSIWFSEVERLDLHALLQVPQTTTCSRAAIGMVQAPASPLKLSHATTAMRLADLGACVDLEARDAGGSTILHKVGLSHFPFLVKSCGMPLP